LETFLKYNFIAKKTYGMQWKIVMLGIISKNATKEVATDLPETANIYLKTNKHFLYLRDVEL
jgi:hypothetical protein